MTVLLVHSCKGSVLGGGEKNAAAEKVRRDVSSGMYIMNFARRLHRWELESEFSLIHLAKLQLKGFFSWS